MNYEMFIKLIFLISKFTFYNAGNRKVFVGIRPMQTYAAANNSYIVYLSLSHISSKNLPASCFRGSLLRHRFPNRFAPGTNYPRGVDRQ